MSKIVMRKLAELKPYENNPTTHPEEQIARLMASIKEFGFLAPIVYDANDVIVMGHCRAVACDRLGIEEAECISAAHLSEEQIRALRIADNKIAEGREWDVKALDLEMDFLKKSGFDLGVAGLDEPLPPFEPGTEDEQGDLDKTKPIICPECGHEFTQSA